MTSSLIGSHLARPWESLSQWEKTSHKWRLLSLAETLLSHRSKTGSDSYLQSHANIFTDCVVWSFINIPTMFDVIFLAVATRGGDCHGYCKLDHRKFKPKPKHFEGKRLEYVYLMAQMATIVQLSLYRSKYARTWSELTLCSYHWDDSGPVLG